MASITWLDLDGNRYESDEYRNIRSFRSYIKKYKNKIRVVELLDCKGLDSLYVESTDNGLFKECVNLTKVEEVITTHQVGDVRNMFSGCSNLTDVPLFDTSNVVLMDFMFQGCSSLESVPCFNTSNVAYMGSMFEGCSKLKEVPHFNTSNVEDMSEMFSDCSSLENVPLFITSNVKDMGFMFIGCSSLKSVPCFNTSKVRGVYGMFKGCSSLLEIPKFDMSNVVFVEHMLAECEYLFSKIFKDRLGVNLLYNFYNSLSDKCKDKDALL